MSSVINAMSIRKAETVKVIITSEKWRETNISMKKKDFASMLAWSQWAQNCYLSWWWWWSWYCYVIHISSWSALASQQRCHKRSSYHELQAMQNTHNRFHASSVQKSSTYERVCWDETRRKERKKESKAEELISTILH